jgi:predicted small lipoprotein YifL
MRTIILLIALCLSLAACGVKGDPEAPPNFTQAQ